MPLPKPKHNENENEFIKRCMADKVMNREFSNSRQRAAICYNIWRKDKHEVMERINNLLKSMRKNRIGGQKYGLGHN